MGKRKNNLQKAFDQHAKMGLRDLPKMKNGGSAPTPYQENAAIPEVQALMGTNRPTVSLRDVQVQRPSQPAIPAATNPAPAPTLPAQMPEPTLIERVRARIKMANGGEVTDKQALAGSTPQTGGVLQQLGTFLAPALTPQPTPRPLNTFPVTQPGKVNPQSTIKSYQDSGLRPQSAMSAVRAANGGLIDKHGLRAAMRAGETGRVVGKGGPREDKVPAMLSNGEYVLPAKTAEALGGPDALDAIVQATNDGRAPATSLRAGAEYGNGLVPYDPVVGQAHGPVLPEPQVTRIPPANPNAVTPYNPVVGQAPGAPVTQPPPRITRAPNPNVDPVRGSAEMRDFMANNPRAPGGGSPLPDVSPADATSVASKGLRFVARAAPAAAAGAGLTGAVQSVAENFTNPEKVQNFATNMGLGAQQGDSDLWRNTKETAAQGLRVLQNIGDATGAGYLGRAIARKLGGENFFDLSGGSVFPPSPAAGAAAAPAAAAAAPAAAKGGMTVEDWMEHIRNGGTPPINGSPEFDEASRRMFENKLTTGVARDANGNVTKMAMTNLNNMGEFPGSRQTVQTPEGRQATLRAAYAPTQYNAEPSSTPSLRRDDLEVPTGSGGINNPNSWDWLVTRKDRRMNLEAQTNAANNATLRRGQDMRYQGDIAQAAAITRKGELEAASDARKAERDQANKDREFKMQSDKMTAEEGRAQQTARAQASEAQRKEIESRFRMKDGDGKDVPDTARAAQYYAAAAKTIPAMIKALEQQGSPAALAKAKALAEKGVGALEPGDHDELMNLFNRRDRMAQAAGLGPNQGTYQHSDNLLDYRQVAGPKGVEKRVFGGNRINTPAGSISANDLRYKDGPANRFLPDWFKTQDRDLTRGLRME